MLQLGPNLSLPHLLQSLGTHTSVLNKAQLIHLIHYQHSIFSPGFPSFQLPKELQLLLCGPCVLQQDNKCKAGNFFPCSHQDGSSTGQFSFNGNQATHDMWKDSWRPPILEFQLVGIFPLHDSAGAGREEPPLLSFCEAPKSQVQHSSVAFHLKTGAMDETVPSDYSVSKLTVLISQVLTQMFFS